MNVAARLAAVLLIWAAASAATAQTKRPTPPDRRPDFERSLQAVVVTTPDWDSIRGTARLFERANARSRWKEVGEAFPVVVGRSGLAWSHDPKPYGNGRSDPENHFTPKREGDGRSPAGIFPLTFAFGRAAKSLNERLEYKPLGEFTECVDDVDSTHYNRVVDRLKVGIFDWQSSEKMLEVGEQYDLGVFVAYNSYPAPVSGRGSCIFLHIWKDAETGTAGCTAMSREDLERLVKWLDPKKNPHLIQLPEPEYKAYRKTWKLPKID
ncbi:MAG: L,D-transpeptidase [Pyrinomonadaceae bacterium]